MCVTMSSSNLARPSLVVAGLFLLSLLVLFSSAAEGQAGSIEERYKTLLFTEPSELKGHAVLEAAQYLSDISIKYRKKGITIGDQKYPFVPTLFLALIYSNSGKCNLASEAWKIFEEAESNRLARRSVFWIRRALDAYAVQRKSACVGVASGGNEIFFLDPTIKSSNDLVKVEGGNLKIVYRVESNAEPTKVEVCYRSRDSVGLDSRCVRTDHALRSSSAGDYIGYASVQLTGEGSDFEINMNVYLPDGKGMSRRFNARVEGGMPKVAVLAVGVDQYRNLPPLSTPVLDARSVAEIFGAMTLSLEPKSLKVVGATDCEGDVVSLDCLAGWLKWLRSAANGKNDYRIFYYAGHGLRDRFGQFSMLMGDYESGDELSASLGFSQLLPQIISEDFDGTSIIIIDACFSGASSELFNLVKNQLAGKSRLFAIFSARASEFAAEDAERFGGSPLVLNQALGVRQ